MEVKSGTWDIRCPDELIHLFPIRRGYYFRVDLVKAGQVLKTLSMAYAIPAPRIGRITKGSWEYAAYEYENQKVLLCHRSHLKSVFHEFYHHLDNMTDGKYDSDDREGGPSSLAWMFAEKLWEKFKSTKLEETEHTD